MSNFIVEFKKGQAGENKGLYMGDGLKAISEAINGIQRQRMYGIASAPKAGKSTFVDYGFLIQPYLYAIENNIPVEWIYFSFEIDRVSKEFDFMTYFLYHDYGIEYITLDEGVRKDGSNVIELSSDYLRGRLQDDEGNTILVKQKIVDVIKIVYEKRIIPLFGEFSANGVQISKGVILFVENKDNPTGIRNFLINHAESKGHFVKNGGKFNNRITGYIPNNPKLFTIIITDHLRKILTERGFQMKQIVDKYLEYTVELRNLCEYTFVHIIHLNRSIGDVQRLKQFGDRLYPSSDDIKDSGNLAEDANYIFTIFNPNDQKYGLTKHFGIDIKDKNGNELYPNLRTIHLVESRHCIFPQHFAVNMFGGYKNFEVANFAKNINT